jgi:predicted DNA-binding transcriptional regulator AlpA
VAPTAIPSHLPLVKGHEELPLSKGPNMEDAPDLMTATDVLQLTRGPSSSGSRDGYGQDTPRRASLPAVLDVPQAARLLGIGRTLAYELVRTDQWPTPVIRVGRLIKIPSAPLIELMSTGYRTRTAAG